MVNCGVSTCMIANRQSSLQANPFAGEPSFSVGCRESQIQIIYWKWLKMTSIPPCVYICQHKT